MMIASFLPKKITSPRWVALFLASILLHLLAIEWAGQRLTLPTWQRDNPAPITAELHFSKGEYFPFPVAPPPPPPTTTRKPKDKSTPPVPIAPTIIVGDDVGMDDSPSEVELGSEVPGTSIESATEIITSDVSAFSPSKPAATPKATEAARPSPTVPVNPPIPETPAVPKLEVPEAPEAPAIAPLKLALPPSVELKYDVVRSKDGQNSYGSAKIRWRNEGDNYTIDSETSVLFFTLLSFKSEGSIDASGVVPLLYVEKRFGKSETNTHFHRERNTISFSASTLTYPRKGNEQDRASVVWQLAGIARGDPEKFLPHTTIELFVAGPRDGEPWLFEIVESELLEINSTSANLVHMVRVPRAGSRDQKLDFWLDPAQEWYPVRMRFTESTGDIVELSLSKLSPLPSHSPR